MKIGQKLIRFGLLVLLLALPVAAQAQFTFTTNNEAITITGYTGSGGDVVFPATTNGYPVTGIGDGESPVLNSTSITNVTIPGSVTSIADIAFYGCIKLANLTFPNNLTNIGAGAFNSCWSLTNVVIPASVSSIGDYAFVYCSNLTSIVVADANQIYSSVDGVLFNKDKTVLMQFPFGKAGSYSIPDTVINLADEAFGSKYGGFACPALTNLSIPGSLVNLRDYAFAYCRGLTSVNIVNGISNIGTNAFLACSSLSSVTIPGSVTNLGVGSFANCNNLSSVTINDGLASISDYAFSSCSRLPSIIIPASVTHIGENAFFFCGFLHLVFFLGDAPDMGNDTTVFSGDALLTIFYLSGKSGWGATFDGIPTKKGSYSSEFAYTVTNNTINIHGYLGSGGTVVIPDTISNLFVTSIGDYAFLGCATLSSITIPGGVTNIGRWSFHYCDNLNAINADANNAIFSSVSGVLFNSGKTIIIEYPAGLTGNYLVPNTVKGIGDYAFSGCNLSSVTIQDGVSSIGEGSFIECFGLMSVVMPNSITNIGNSAFAQCTNLENITIPCGVTSLGDLAFGYCDNLTSVFFESNAPSITGLNIFNNASHLTIYYLPNTTGWSVFSMQTGAPTALWLPAIQTGDSNFGMKTNQFSFNLNWANGQTVVVEACTNLSNPDWQPVQTNVLTTGSAYFSDPQWTNYPGRFYRLRSL